MPSEHAAPGLSRRRLAQYTAATAVAGAVSAGPATASARPGTAGRAPLEPVAPLPGDEPRRADFAPGEQRLAPYAATLAALANAVEDEDPDTYGYLTGGWWREWPNTFNARVQENVLTLAWFHRTERAWNPYAGDPALLARLDAALRYYLKLQFPDGSWPEYYPQEHSRATTGFALVFLSSTLGHLEASRALPRTRRLLVASLRKAARWFLDPGNTLVWNRHIAYSNHLAGGLHGIAQFLALHPDRAMRRRLEERIEALAEGGLSPAGHWYEESGADVNYSLDVMAPDLAALHELTGSRAALELMRTEEEWLSHNLVREPDGSGFVCNVAPSTRTSTFFLDDAPREEERANLNRLWPEHLPAMAAYLPTDEDVRASRAAWRASGAPVEPLGKGKVSPAPVRDSEYPDRHPTRAQKDAALAEAPYLRSSAYVEHRADPMGQDYLFVRRPSYYCGSHYGRRATDRVRNGLSFWWHPRAGMVVHSLNNTDTGCWTTAVEAGDIDRLEARSTLRFEYLSGAPGEGERIQDPSTVTGSGVLSVVYTAVGDVMRKQVVHEPDALRVRVEAPVAFSERIPLVLREDDALSWTGSGADVRPGQESDADATGLRIRRGDTTVTVTWDRPLDVRLLPTATTYFRDRGRRQHVLTLAADGPLEYRIGE